MINLHERMLPTSAGLNPRPPGIQSNGIPVYYFCVLKPWIVITMRIKPGNYGAWIGDLSLTVFEEWKLQDPYLKQD